MFILVLNGTGNEDAGVHGDVDGDEKERDDILREQVKQNVKSLTSPKRNRFWTVHSFGMINDPRSLGSWCIK